MPRIGREDGLAYDLPTERRLTHEHHGHKLQERTATRASGQRSGSRAAEGGCGTVSVSADRPEAGSARFWRELPLRERNRRVGKRARRRPAVDDELGTRDVGRSVREQEGNELRYLMRLPDALQRGELALAA